MQISDIAGIDQNVVRISEKNGSFMENYGKFNKIDPEHKISFTLYSLHCDCH